MEKFTYVPKTKKRANSNQIEKFNIYAENTDLLAIAFIELLINTDLKTRLNSGTIAATEIDGGTNNE